MKRILVKILQVNMCLALLCATGLYAQDLKLWYSKPAEKWTDALPLGNGRLGAMVFGGVERERIQFNEETLWTGEPREYSREGAAAYLPELRRLIFDGKQKEAEDLAQEKFMGRKSTEGKRELWFNEMRGLRGLRGNPALANYDDRKWKEMKLPTPEGWEAAGWQGLDGAVWFRTSFDLPVGWAGKDLVLDLGKIRDHDFTYLNGELIGTTESSTEGRKYTIRAGLLRKGKNHIAVQVLNYFDKGGFTGYKDTTRRLWVYPEGQPETTGISLSKAWKFLIQNDEPPAVARFQADYQPFGDLLLDFEGQDTVQQYRRELDLSEAVARTSYQVGGVVFTREYFVSAPDQAIVVRLTADKPGKVSFNASLGSPHKYSSVRKISSNTIALSVKVRDGVLKGESYLMAVPRNGRMTVTANGISIRGADDVTLYLTAGTSYKNYRDVSGDPVAACRAPLAAIRTKGYDLVKTAHISEYQRWFNTFSVGFGNDDVNSKLPTDERIGRFAVSDDPSFAALYMQYGRYLLISSSRPGTRPANLQGIWNELLTPPWGSKYTTNINLEMNYWPAEPLNLSAMHEPLFRMMEDLKETGTRTARMHYNAPGWVLHHNTDLWRGTAPINASNHGIWVSGAAWLCHHLWEHYRYTGDENFLRERAYPLMREAARFFNTFLIRDPRTGWLISTPSNSPENGGLVAGPTMDHQIIRDLFNNCISAASVLKTDPVFTDSLKQKLEQIAPNQIGRYGQLQEWLEDKDDTTNKHRHVSHLWGVHPGSEINWDDTPELMKAARQSLIYRGDEGTGWSLAWKINFWSRFKDGDHAYKMVKMLISPAAKGGGSYVNLFDAHPPFQIDGNFGGAAGIAEMLLQSHSRYIELLPALPSALKEGEVKGICARGAFELSFSWKKGQLQHVEVYSKAGNECVLRYGAKEARFNTIAGRKYTLNAALELEE